MIVGDHVLSDAKLNEDLAVREFLRLGAKGNKRKAIFLATPVTASVRQLATRVAFSHPSSIAPGVTSVSGSVKGPTP